MTVIIRNADVDHVLSDVIIANGVVVDARPAGEPSAHTRSASAAAVVDAEGGALLPGLTDHHLHLMSMAAHAQSVVLTRQEAPTFADIARLVRDAAVDEHGWIRGVGYDATARGALDAETLDHIRADVPIRIQDRSGALWMLNTPALRTLGGRQHTGIERDAHGHPTGLLWRADELVRSVVPSGTLPDLTPVIDRLLSMGVTAVTDATPDLSAPAAQHLAMASHPLRIQLLGAPNGTTFETMRARIGPQKIVLADSGLPSFDELRAAVQRAFDSGRGVAIHAVTLDALYLAIAVFDDVGVLHASRVEHAAIAPDDAVHQLAKLGVGVVTQPGFLGDRGDLFARDADPFERPLLYRGRGFLRGGVRLALSSDAPYGPANPWHIMQNAVDRLSPDGPLSKAEALSPREALDAHLGPLDQPGGIPRTVSVGEVADLALMHDDLTTTLGNLGAAQVRSVWIAGRVEIVDGVRASRQ